MARRVLQQYTFELSKDKVNDDLACKICQKLSTDIYQTYCGCTYCYKCIQHYLSEGSIYCNGGKPNCKKNLLILDTNVCKSPFLNTKILNAIVVCPNDSCCYNDKLTHMEEHLQVCSKQPMKCPFVNIGCTDGIFSKDTIQTHIIEKTLSHIQLLLDCINQLKYEFNESILENASSRKDLKIKGTQMEEKINEIVAKLVDKDDKIASLERESRDNKEELKTVKMESKANKEELKTLATELKANKEELKTVKMESKANKDEIKPLNIESMKNKEELKAVPMESKKELTAVTMESKANKKEFKAVPMESKKELTAVTMESKKELKAVPMESKANKEEMKTLYTSQMTIKEEKPPIFRGLMRSDSELLTRRVLPIYIESNTMEVTAFTVERFEQRSAAKECIFSHYFYSHMHGYKLRLEVSPGRYSRAHLSVFVSICKGEYDGSLDWPCKYTFDVALINRYNREIHLSNTINYGPLSWHTATDQCKHLFGRPIKLDNKGYGYSRFEYLTDLQSIDGLIVEDAITVKCTARPPP